MSPAAATAAEWYGDGELYNPYLTTDLGVACGDFEAVQRKQDSEIFFAPNITLDNGLQFGIDINLKDGPTADTLLVVGPDFGSIGFVDGGFPRVGCGEAGRNAVEGIVGRNGGDVGVSIDKLQAKRADLVTIRNSLTLGGAAEVAISAFIKAIDDHAASLRTPPSADIYAGFRYTPFIDLGAGFSIPTDKPDLDPFNQFEDVDRGFNVDGTVGLNIIPAGDGLNDPFNISYGIEVNFFYSELDNNKLENDFFPGSLSTNPGKSKTYGFGPRLSLYAPLIYDFSGELNAGVNLVRREFDLQNGGVTVAEAKGWTWGYNLGAVIWHPIPGTPACIGAGAEYRYVDDINGRVNGGPSFDLEGQGQVNVTGRIRVPLDGLFGGPTLGGATICY